MTARRALILMSLGAGGAAGRVRRQQLVELERSAPRPPRPPAPAATATTATTTTTAAIALGPEGIPLEQGPDLAPAATTTQGATVDGVQCAPIEQLVYHIHAHLQVYVDGQPRALPAAIGMVGPVSEQTPYGPFYGAQQCYYWLHTHASDGVIHIESPSVRIYTLGNFFDEWNQPLSATAGGRRQGQGHRVRQRQAVDEGPARDPAHSPRLDPARRGLPGRAAHEISWAGTNL